MRLLNLDADFDLEALGFMKAEREMLNRAIRFENGVVVISGPTGSGKTRTLYALLKALDPRRFNIVTLEDPIEYRIEGLNQVQVNSQMTFADVLRSVLRQDPDVILVGEVRDSETAKLCFQAAETGHLVFTTLHANGALEVIERLSGLGVERLALESNLRLSVAQRLEQKLCADCAQSASATVLDWYGEQTKESVQNQIKARDHQGCANCIEGIHGRIPVLEWAEVSETSGKKLFATHQTLREVRILRALRGEIDAQEVQSVYS